MQKHNTEGDGIYMIKSRNAIVGQSGGPTAAINATLAGVIAGAAECDFIDRIYGAFNGIQGILEERFTELNHIFQDAEALSILKQTPAAALGSCRKKLPPPDAEEGRDTYRKIFEFFKENDIGYFFYIGGNDSMDTVAKLSSYAVKNGISDLHFIGVPKTIDCDLCGTSHTPGYGSAAKYIATTMQEILRDTAVYTVKAVTIVEIMGRDAGWLAAACALPRIISSVGPDYVYLPEVPFNTEAFYRDIEEAFEKHPNVVIAVSEGIRDKTGKYVGEASQSGAADAFGHRYLQGTAKSLEFLVKERFGCKVRSVELNLPQRCAAHLLSATDIDESFGVGRAAVLYSKENSGVMICYRRSDEPYSVSFEPSPVSKIANGIRNVPLEFITRDKNNVTDECLRYILPLIMGEMNIVFEGGIPKHFLF